MTIVARKWAFALGVTCASCTAGGEKAVAPPPAPPPEVVAVFPANRSDWVPTDTEIWAQFDRPLDPASLTPGTVLLKRDTYRIPVQITWNPDSHRVVLHPLGKLELRHTHTVTFTEEVRTIDGTALSDGFFWQFTTNGVRRPAAPTPADGRTGTPPLAQLAWEETEPSAGPAQYELFLSTDSSAVATRGLSPLAVVTEARYFPTQPWALSSRLFWSVRATNLSTQESVSGPVWSFLTIPSGLPVDSVALACNRWGWLRVRQGLDDILDCYGLSIGVGPTYNSALDWDLSVLPSDAALEGATLLLSTSNPTSAATLQLWGTDEAWAACDFDYPGPPYPDSRVGSLGTGASIGGGIHRFSSTKLAAHLQARLDGGPFSGYTVRSPQNVGLASPSAADMTRRPNLTVRFFRAGSVIPTP